MRWQGRNRKGGGLEGDGNVFCSCCPLSLVYSLSPFLHPFYNLQEPRKITVVPTRDIDIRDPESNPYRNTYIKLLDPESNGYFKILLKMKAPFLSVIFRHWIREGGRAPATLATPLCISHPWYTSASYLEVYPDLSRVDDIYEFITPHQFMTHGDMRQ